MCDQVASQTVNVTAEEQECRFCTNYNDCRNSGCLWNSRASITHADLLSGEPLGTCLDGRDWSSILLSVIIMSIGGCMVIWSLGWCMKDSGKMATLRRYGVAVDADIVARHSLNVHITIMEGFPPVPATHFYVDIEFHVDRHKRTKCHCLRFRSSGGAEDWEATQMEGHVGINKRQLDSGKWYTTMQCSEEQWYEQKQGMRVIYDPLDLQNIMPATAVPGQPTNRIMFAIAGFTSLVCGGIIMDLGAHGCLPREECCNAEPILRACDGLGGRSHETVCDSPCSKNWVMFVLLGGMFGFMTGVIAVLLHNEGAFKSFGLLSDFVCGTGLFCVPEKFPDLSSPGWR